jgi:F-type H+-transporting ATPase subunit gamma
MANLKDIRNRIGTVQSIQQVTKAMKLVAAAKLRRSQTNMEQARPYAQGINGVLKNLLPSLEREIHPLLKVPQVHKKLGLVVITADRGLCGSFNANILKTAHKTVDAYGKDNVSLICFGKKGRDYFKRREYNVVESHVDFWNALGFDSGVQFARSVATRYLSGEFDEVKIIYNNFKNVAQQEIVVWPYLPLVLDEGDEKDTSEYLFEPDKEVVVQSLVPRHLNVQMWRFLLESNAAEQAARMMAMENATDNAGELISDLQLEYNKARQTAITNEILEIVGGAEALVE